MGVSSTKTMYTSFNIGRAVPEDIPLTKDDIVQIYKANGRFDHELAATAQQVRTTTFERIEQSRQIDTEDNPENAEVVVVMDVCETVIYHDASLAAENFNQSKEAIESRWCLKKGLPRETTQILFNDLVAAGVDVHFITSRPESMRTPTLDLLSKSGFNGWKSVTFKQDGDTQSDYDFKLNARNNVVKTFGTSIFASVGDSPWDGGNDCEVNFRVSRYCY